MIYFLNGLFLKVTDNYIKQNSLNSMRKVQYSVGRPQLLLKHSLFSEVIKFYPKECRNYSSFSVVRDPFDRTRSILNYILNIQSLPRLNLLRRAFEEVKRSPLKDLEYVLGRFMGLNYFKP